jgi:CheY-like chemotaxis protein/glycine cleavage system H lipoate-binding protein
MMSDQQTRILVVDDEQVVLDSVRKHLKKEAYELRTVLSAADALSCLESEPIEVVITDLMMPGMDGLEMMEEMQRRGCEQPVVMITGYATMRTALQALRKGAFDYIAKPFTRAELQGVVSRAVRQSTRAGGAEAPAPARDAAGPDAYHHLGGHCWVLVLPDGSARIGLEETFALTVGDIDEIELPAAGDYVEQGSVCLRILTSDGKTHTLWSALSGSILEVNPALETDPSVAVREPYKEGWLLRLDPGNLEDELKGLDLT